MRQRVIEAYVGLFMLLGFCALAMLAFKVSGLTNYVSYEGYTLSANFANIGDLKPRSPVTIAGVRVGQVTSIRLNPKTYEAEVLLRLNKNVDELPNDTSASIFTQGLLGSNYVNLEPGYGNELLKNGGRITQTHPALILENLIGQLLFKINDGSDKKAKA